MLRFFLGVAVGFVQHRVHANPPPKAPHKSPTAAGMREHNRSQQPKKKKPVLRLKERKKFKTKNKLKLKKYLTLYRIR